MTTVLENTRICSYKGVEFYCDRISSTSGRTKANYLFLNSGRRVSKDLGALPKSFRVSGYTYSQDGDEYADKRDALRSVLDSPLDGEFAHPFVSENFWCSHGQYTWDEDFGEINICRFEFVLEQVSKDGDNPLTPTGQLFNKSQIKALALDTNRKLQAASAAAFSTTTLLNKESGASLFESAGNKMRGAFGSIGDTLSKANDYAGKALDIVDQATYYANNPLAGFAALADGLLGIDGLTADLYKKFRTIQAMFDFGDSGSDTNPNLYSPTRITSNPTNLEDAERTRNANVMKTFIQGAAAAQAFSQAGTSEPETTDEIDEFNEVLEDQFEKVSALLTSDNEEQTATLGTAQPDYSESYESIVKLRGAVAGYLNQKRANAAYVKTIRVSPMPCSELAYKLYRDSSRMDEIMQLNGLTDCFEVSGDLRVLSK